MSPLNIFGLEGFQWTLNKLHNTPAEQVSPSLRVKLSPERKGLLKEIKQSRRKAKSGTKLKASCSNDLLCPLSPHASAAWQVYNSWGFEYFKYYYHK